MTPWAVATLVVAVGAALLGPAMSPAAVLLVGGLVPVACGIAVAVLAGRRGVGGVPAPHVPAVPVVTALMVVRGGAWLLLALDSRDGVVGMPAPGDAVGPVVGVLAVLAAVLRSPVRTWGRSWLLGLDTVIASCASLFALWVTVVGPRVGHDLSTSRALWVLCLVGVVAVQMTSGALVLSRGALSRSSLSVLALLLITVADVEVLLDGLSTLREPSRVALVCWVLGWMLLARRVLTVRSGAAPVEAPHAHARQEILSTDLATITSAGAFAVVVAALVVGGTEVLRGPMPAVLCLVAIVAWVAREIRLGIERVRLLDELREQATRDPLTRLVNRRGVTQRLAGLTPGAEWVIAAVDLDGFKAVNDIHGHEIGDEVLVATAEALRGCCPPHGIVARTGGDEFAVLLPGDVRQGQGVASSIVEEVGRRLAALELVPTITASVGVGRLRTSSIPGPGAAQGPDRLTALVEAAAALRAAKAGGRNRVALYPGAVAVARERRLVVERRLRAAMRADDVVTHVQPVVDLSDGRLVGGEALARWDDELLGEVSPEEFIPVAEQTGLVAELGAALLRNALLGADACGASVAGLRVAVNVSPIQLRAASFVPQVREALEGCTLAPRNLVVEVTEAVLIEDDDPALRSIEALQRLGITLAIDDFGTGYAALGYLRGMPVDLIKVDRSLLAAAATAERTRRIVSGVVDLAHRIGVEVAIEGIEQPQAARLCRVLGADFGQGWLYGAAMPWTDFGDRIRTPRPAPATIRAPSSPRGGA